MQLSGASSSDPDGDNLSFSWFQTSGPLVTITNADQAIATVTLPQVSVATTLVFQLTVTDPSGASAADSVAVTVNDVPAPNRAPTADAGADGTADEGTSVSLSGAASSDPDGDTLSFSWSQTSGPSGTMTNADQAVASVRLPQVSAATTLTFQLTVTDPSGASATDSMAITVSDVTASPPPSNSSSGGGPAGPLWLALLATVGYLRGCLRRLSRGHPRGPRSTGNSPGWRYARADTRLFESRRAA